VNLVAPEAVAAFEDAVRESYQARFGITPQIYRCRPSAGAGDVE
jgi:galactokinase